MLQVCSARLVAGTIDVGGPGPQPAVVRLRTDRVARLLGTEIPVGRCREILESLGFGVADAPDGLDVTVPHFRRNDVTREADLIEEVARMDGVEHLPSTLPARRGASGLLSHFQRIQRRAPRTCWWGVAWTRSWAGASPRRASAIGCAWETMIPGGAW